MCGHRENETKDVIRYGGEGEGRGDGCDMKDSICRLDLGKQVRCIESQEEEEEEEEGSQHLQNRMP